MSFFFSSRFFCDLKYELSNFALSLSFAYISSFCLSGSIIDLSGFFSMKDLSIFYQFLLFVSMFFITSLLVCRNNVFFKDLNYDVVPFLIFL